MIHAKKPGAISFPIKISTALGSREVSTNVAPTPFRYFWGEGKPKISRTMDCGPSAPTIIEE